MESLEKRDARRGRCLDRCLVLSVIVLFAAVTALAVAGILVFQELRLHPKSEMSKVTSDARENTFKNQNFAYLEANSGHLMTRTMEWSAVSYRDGTSVGSNYVFDPKQHSLRVIQAGNYFMYLELNVTCHHRCEAGHFTVHLSDKLSCKVQLPANISTPVNTNCWAVSWLSADTYLLSQMDVASVPIGQSIKGWKLALRGSGFGMFLVN